VRSIRHCVLATTESDSHVWNLVSLQKLIEELGVSVRNLGPCTPVAEVVAAVLGDDPDLVVVSSVNGHARYEARTLLEALHGAGAQVPCVIGGKLTVAESDLAAASRELLAAGYWRVFIGDDAVTRFRTMVRPATVRLAALPPRGLTPRVDRDPSVLDGSRSVA
jgi:methylaspartate mutase sigma subunit